MANRKKTLGRVVDTAFGYSVRIILESKTVEKTDRNKKVLRTSYMGDSGKYGIYAGKNLVQGGFSTKTDAINHCQELYLKS